jgi:uncharacterized protein with GYD domain
LKLSRSKRLAAVQDTYQAVGLGRVHELMSAEKCRVVAVLEAERDERLYYLRLKVAEDYPHPITQYIHRPHGGE